MIGITAHTVQLKLMVHIICMSYSWVYRFLIHVYVASPKILNRMEINITIKSPKY
jgi:hypothetical protein